MLNQIICSDVTCFVNIYYCFCFSIFSELDDEIAKNATSYSKLAELTKEKEDVERQLEEKMERWEYLNDLAEKIEKQKQ